jgi:sec-independent protein translocase protein TatA
MVPNIGPLELAIILIIVLLIVGPKKLPQLARSMGSGARELKDSFSSKSDKDDDHAEKAPAPSAIAPSASAPAEAQVVQGEPVPERR